MNQNKKGNVAVVAIIIVIVAITAGIIGWLFTKKSQVQVQPVATQSTPTVAQTQPVTTPTPTAPATQPQTNNQKTATAPADWKTYTNSKYGFTFSYPSSWFVLESPKDKAIYIQTANNLSPDTNYIKSNPKFIRIWITYDPKEAAMYSPPVELEQIDTNAVAINGIQVELKTMSGDGGASQKIATQSGLFPAAKWTIKGTTYYIGVFTLLLEGDKIVQDTLKNVIYSLKPIS